jgi:hypothetical protein
MCGLHVVVNMGFLGVIGHLSLKVLVMGMHQLCVVVLVAVPVGPVLPVAHQPILVVVRDVIVVMLVHRGWMDVRSFATLARGPLGRLSLASSRRGRRRSGCHG